MDKKYERYLKVIDEEKGALYRLSDQIWDSPETAYTEYVASTLQIEFLRKRGFQIQTGLGSIPTAFSARFGNGKPVIGITGEYDALENLSQKADILCPDPVEKGGVGHGCGHNMLGVGAIAAAISVKQYLEKNKKAGTVIYFGCPAEEGGSGKAFLAREGVFKECDLVFSWHPGVFNQVLTGNFLANVMVSYRFSGISAHAAANPDQGRSALDAVELMNVGANFLREHVHKDARLHYAITNSGGSSPNVVPAYAEVVYLIRAPEMEQVHTIRKRVDKIAQGAALMTETSVDIQFLKACANVLRNSVLEQELYKNMCEVPLPEYSQEELAYAQNFTRTVVSDSDAPRMLDGVAAKFNKEERSKILMHRLDAMNSFLLPYREPEDNEILYGSTDVGDVSWQCPTAQIGVAAWAPDTPGHSWQVVAQGKSSIAHKSICYAGKVLARAAIDILENPEIIVAAKKEHSERMRGRTYTAIPEDVMPGMMRQGG